jgi:hypothetical protein
MSVLEELRAHYQALLSDGDNDQRQLAAVCLTELSAGQATTKHDRDYDGQRAHWGHVLVDVIIASGNQPLERGSGELKSGHEPLHASSSGTCVSISRDRGVWWCSSCQRGGTAVEWIRSTRNLSYTSATAWLRLRFGPPQP